MHRLHSNYIFAYKKQLFTEATQRQFCRVSNVSRDISGESGGERSGWGRRACCLLLKLGLYLVHLLLEPGPEEESTKKT